MQTPLPVPVEGQPVWVTILLYVLGAGVTLGVAYLALKGRKSPGGEPAPATVSASDPVHNELTVIEIAMEHLAEGLKRETKRTERLEKQLRESDAERTRLQGALERCQQHATYLARKEQGVRDDPP